MKTLALLLALTLQITGLWSHLPGNARARLATLYGTRQRLWIDQGASGGFRVSMELPYHT